MKKFMLAVAIVCAATMVQAASITWGSNNMHFCDAAGKPTTTMTGGQLVLVTLGSSINWNNATEIPTSSTADVRGTTTVAINDKSGSRLGRVSGQVSFDYVGKGSDLIDNNDYLALMWKDSDGNLSKLLYTDGTTVGDEAVYKVSGLAEDTTGVTGAAIGFKGDFKAPASGDIPEPTSGLLLAVGGALLALRRKQK